MLKGLPLKTQHLFTAHTSCVPVSSPPVLRAHGAKFLCQWPVER